MYQILDAVAFPDAICCHFSIFRNMAPGAGAGAGERNIKIRKGTIVRTDEGGEEQN